jgi:hypothetical protein
MVEPYPVEVTCGSCGGVVYGPETPRLVVELLDA